MDSMEANTAEEGMRLRVAFLHWAGCLAIFIALVALGSSFNSTGFKNTAFLFYFVAGFYLSRTVLKKIVEWHPVYDTLYNVTSSKLKFFFLWPITWLSHPGRLDADCLAVETTGLLLNSSGF